MREAIEERFGRSVGQALDVDGVTHLSELDGAQPGDFVRVEITEAMEYDLVGTVVSASMNES